MRFRNGKKGGRVLKNNLIMKKTEAEKRLDMLFNMLFEQIFLGIEHFSPSKTPERPFTKREQKLYDEMKIEFIYEEDD